MKKIIISILTIIVAGLIIGFIINSNRVSTINDTDMTNNNPMSDISINDQQIIQLCFYNKTKTPSGFYDVSWLKMNITGDQVTGEFRNIPAEKDSKVGLFNGTVEPVDKVAMARTADVWWDSMAEGMQVKEQLKIVFGEGTAQVAYGEMVDRGDGVYVYKDGAKITYGQAMTDVACNDLKAAISTKKVILPNDVTTSVKLENDN
jgi:hypothetical protein